MKRPPDISISRLAVYFRFLNDYLKEKGASSTINSEELARSLDINPHQIRKDLSYFGKFGRQGVGYCAGELRDRIAQILGLDRKWNLCLCGLGNLGSALFAYRGFREMNLRIVAIFDDDPRKAGTVLQGVKVYHPKHLARVVRKLRVDIGIVAVPSAAAQAIVAKLIAAGIRTILNFAPAQPTFPVSVKLRSVDLSTELINLTYFLASHLPAAAPLPGQRAAASAARKDAVSRR